MSCYRCGKELHENDVYWLLGLASQKKKQLVIISTLVIHLAVFLYFLIFIMVLVLVFELLEEDSGITVWGENRWSSLKILLRVLLNGRYKDLGSFKGYRSMHQTLKQSYGVHVPRDSLMKILKEMNLNGTEERKGKKLKKRKYFSTRPNATWHVDGLDKLKPYSFPIHGWVAGCSRKIMRLKMQ